MYDLIEKSFLYLADAVFARRPASAPSPSRLAAGKIISHRGQHDNLSVMENTLEGFDIAMGAGVWGLEFDIRWTRDLKPVVFHDQDLERIFNDPRQIREIDRQVLKRQFPLIPTLEEVVQRYERRVHLMVELKAEPYPDPRLQASMLADVFSRLEPMRDYHFLTLDADMFAHVGFAPPTAYLPVAQLNFRALSRLALSRGYAGVAGHYLFINNRITARHHARGQHVGVGYPRSANSLFREMNRGVEWIFTNHAVEMQQVVDERLGKNRGAAVGKEEASIRKA